MSFASTLSPRRQRDVEAPASPSRRRFITVAAGVAAGTAVASATANASELPVTTLSGYGKPRRSRASSATSTST